ncbi:hypothetical protein SDC9_209445 [bioreactor metagenome]|uniref:Uncharacterized protein n=1 Tax=bioreactor metagenome TaxID=1076179 RepID=A0A645JQ86_9ZZZZ
MLVYAIVLIIIILFKPRGLLGTKEFSIVNFKDFISRDKNNKHGEKAEKKGGVE